MEDIAAVKEELEEKQQALEALQRNFNDFQESSRELEEELEAELGRTQDQVSELTNRLAEVAGRLGEQQAKNRSLSSEVAVAQAETARLRAAATRAAAEKTSLEQAADELEAKCRAAIAAEEDSRHKLDLAIEERIFVSNDLEDLRAETLRTEQKLRSDIDDLRQELGRLGNGSAKTPPQMVLPRELAATRFDPDANGDGVPPTVDGGAVLVDRNEGGGRGGDGLVLAGGGGESGEEEDGEGIADELIKALEEEIEGLKAELVISEETNDELNLELQELQERELARGGAGAMNGSSADTLDTGGGGGKGATNGGDGRHSPRTLEEQEALKRDLADAMATCEELDQTVTDLTDDLHAKDEQRLLLETRMAELEAELGSRTQSLQDELLEAKTNASSLTARLADTAAELRAATSRLEDVSAKAKAAQNREEMLREEAAALRERVSELTAAVSDLTADLSDREASLEESQAAADDLRAEVAELRRSLDGLSARMAEESAAREAAEGTAAEREEALRGELQVANEAVAAAAAAAAAQPTGPEEITTGGGGQKEGQSSGEPATGGAEAGAAVGNGSTPSRELTGAQEGAVSPGAKVSTVKERRLTEEVARLKAALEEAQEKARSGVEGRGVVSVPGLDAQGSSSVAAALESGDVDVLKSELQSVADLYGKERSANASLLSKIRALRGNIEVICRIRPPTLEEKALGVPMALEALGDGEVGVKTSGRHVAGGGGTGSWRSFTLDKALGPSTTQEEVFRQVEPLALSAADGMNACIFAYGQTGSGKTHTMIGDARGGEMAGISYRTMNKLFQVLELRRRQQPDYVFTVKVAMLEIYNEDVRDLLSDSSPSTSSHSHSHSHSSSVGGGGDSGAEGAGKLEIRRDQDGMVQVPGLTQVVVSSAQEVLALLERGGGARAVAATGVHDDSSRSHSVLLAEVSCRAGPDALPATGRLFLVDLAGSERVKVSGVTGVGLREATNINSSLSALGDVMQALDQKQKHVPYRNSKLTFLLQDALGGNSRTAMVVTVCPTTLNVDETLFALQFATRARNVSLGPAHKNVGAKNLLEEGKDLRAKLREAARKKEHAEEALATLQREHARSQQKMNALLESRVKNVGDVRQQLEHQIESLKSQLEASQAAVLTERNKRAAFEAETEDVQRQLKRSVAKVAALGRDREEREVKLRAKQEEVGELKAELRKTTAEAKNTERRLSAGIGIGGRRSSGSSAFGFSAMGGDGSGGGCGGKGPPHTPSKKLCDAKNRYTRHRQSTPGRRRPSISGDDSSAPYMSVSPPAAVATVATAAAAAAIAPPAAPAALGGDDGEAWFATETRAADRSTARDGRVGSMFTPAVAAAAAAADADDGRGANSGDRGSAAETVAPSSDEGDAAAAVAAAAASGGGVREEEEEEEAGVSAAGAGAADDVAKAIARATAVFAAAAAPAAASAAATTNAEAGGEDHDEFERPMPRVPSGGSGGSGGGSGGGSSSGKSGNFGATAAAGRNGGDKRPSTSGSRIRVGGASSSLMKGTAASSSRLKLSVPSASEDSRTGSGPRSARRVSTSATPRSTSTPRGFGAFGSSASARAFPPSPAHSRIARTASFTATTASSRSGIKPKTPRTRSSVSGPVGSAAAAAAAAAAASSASAKRRNTVQPPPSPAHGVGGGVGAGGTSSSRSIPGPGARKGWLGEKARGGVGGAGSGHGSGSGSGSGASGGSGTGAAAGTVASRSLSASGGTRQRKASSETGGGGSGGGSCSGVDQLSRAQIALNRHQARMDRIREKREERLANREGPA